MVASITVLLLSFLGVEGGVGVVCENPKKLMWQE
jgi:hypothetical protein